MLIACQVRWMPDGTTLSDQWGGRGDYWNMKWYWVTDKQIKQSSKQRLEMVRVEKRWRDQSSRKSQRCEERGLCVDCVCVCGLCPLHAPLVVYKGNCTRFNCNICWIKKEREREIGKEIADAWGALFTRRECGVCVCAEACVHSMSSRRGLPMGACLINKNSHS